MDPTSNDHLPRIEDRPVIIVAEDEPAIRLMLANKLAAAGWHVVTASNGEDALTAARRTKPRLLLTDFQMPLLDGISMARKLHADPVTAGVPVMLLSARGHRLTATDLLETRIEHVLMKPFSTREVVALAEEYRERTLPASAAA